MRLATPNEIEYLGSMDGLAGQDRKLIREMSRRLDALRRYDQCFCEADWQPRGTPDGRPVKAYAEQAEAFPGADPQRSSNWPVKGI